jgi:hypothetical protein
LHDHPRTLARVTELIRVSHGLWLPHDAVASLRDRCAAVLSVLPAGAALAGRTAAALHSMWLAESEHVPIDVVLTRPGELPRAYAHARRAEARTRRRTLRPDELCLVDGLLSTTRERAWIDLSEELSLPDLVACGDSVLRGPGLRVPLEDMLRRARGRRGVRRARAALPLLDPRSRSRPESHLRVALVCGGLPAPEVNRPIFDEHGQWLAEPDLHYKVPRLALEYQGADHAELDRMRRDITRGVDVIDGGWLSVPLGPAEVFGRPWTLAPFVTALIQRRAPGWLREWRETMRVARNNAPLAG